MNRREFFLAEPLDIQWIWLPPSDNYKSDIFFSPGYVGGTCEFQGQEYSVLYSETAEEFKRVGEEQLHADLRRRVRERLTYVTHLAGRAA